MSIRECSQPTGVKLKMRGCKLSSVNCQGVLKQKGIKQTGVKQGLGVTKSAAKLVALSVKPCTVYNKQLLNLLWFVLKAKLLQKPSKFCH